MSESPPRELDDDRTPVPVRERADGYYRNGEWVPRNPLPDPPPAGVRERLDRWLQERFGTGLDDRRVQGAAVAIAAVLLLLLVLALNRGAAPAKRPEQERKLLDAVAVGQQAVQEGNDLTVVTAARDRNSTICGLLPEGGRVKDWVGTITDLGKVTGGDQGHLTVSIGNSTKLRTWSHASEDTSDHTLVDSHSDVYQALADLNEGDRVRFSGTFRHEAGSCVHETSLFDRNGMQTPSFLFRFTAVDPR